MKVVGYRTYIFLVAALLMQVLRTFGFDAVTSEELNAAVEVLLVIGAWIFHALHKPKPPE